MKVLICIIFLFLTTSSFCQENFDINRINYKKIDGINGAHDIFTIDIDGDSDIDIISASYLDNKVFLHLNTNGTFDTTTVITNVDGIYSVFAIDMDGDNDIDIVTASETDDKIAWHANDGSENFTSTTLSTSSDGARDVYCIDVDGDTHIDIVSVSFNDDKLTWFENTGTNGDATSFTTHDISTSIDGATSVYAIDIDKDSDIDIVTAGFNDDKIRLHKNDGSENFTESTLSSGADGATSVFCGDINKDSEIDIISTSNNDDELKWFENDGSENFTEVNIHSFLTDIIDAMLVDVNGDNYLDIVVVSSNTSIFYGDVYWFENNQDETFTEHEIVKSINDVYAVDTNHMNGDSNNDIIIASYSLDQVNILQGNGSHFNVAEGAYGIYISDIDKDNDKDIIVAADDESSVYWYKNDGLNNFTHTVLGQIPTTATDVFVIDLDEDNDLDVIAAGNYDQVVWFKNDGSNSFTLDTLFEDAIYLEQIKDIFIIDLDKDNDYDILTAASAGNYFCWWENNGSESFTRHLLGYESYAWEIEAVDLDEDNDLDIVTAGFWNDNLRWWENNGSQTFTQRTISFSASYIKDFVIEDLDEDGDLDVIASSSKVTWYSNDGNESFTANELSNSSSSTTNVKVVDIDNDNDLDIISTHSNGNLEQHINDGSENFTTSVIHTANDMIALELADMNGDNKIDLFSVSDESNDVSWYLNGGSDLYVSLIEFRGHRIANNVSLSWSTAIEENSDYFILEKSYHQKHWQQIAEIKSSGNSSVSQHYQYIDKNEDKRVYYRLSEVDLNGRKEIFTPIEINNISTLTSAPVINIYPNPSTNYFTISSANLLEDIPFEVINIQGEIMMKENITLTNNKIIEHNLPRGFYLINLKHKKHSITKKIIVK